MSENTSASAQSMSLDAEVPVTVTIPIGAILAARVDRFEDYDGYRDDHGSVAENVQAKVAQILAGELRSTVQDGIKAAIEAQVTDLVSNAIRDGLLFDFAGKGRPLAEVVVEKAKEWPNDYPRDSYGSRGSRTNMQRLIEEVVKTEMERELRPVIDAAKKEIKAAVTAKASELVLKAAADVTKLTVL